MHNQAKVTEEVVKAFKISFHDQQEEAEVSYDQRLRLALEAAFKEAGAISPVLWDATMAVLTSQIEKPTELMTGTTNWASYIARAVLGRATEVPDGIIYEGFRPRPEWAEKAYSAAVESLRETDSSRKPVVFANAKELAERSSTTPCCDWDATGYCTVPLYTGAEDLEIETARLRKENETIAAQRNTLASRVAELENELIRVRGIHAAVNMLPVVRDDDFSLKPSATHSMSLGERIAHVGGDYSDRVTFGSVMAVHAFIMQIMRDLRYDCLMRNPPTLTERLRAGSECAPWVRDEVEKLEVRLGILLDEAVRKDG